VSENRAREIVEGFNRDVPAEAHRYRITWTGTTVEVSGGSWEIDQDGSNVFALVQLIEQLQDQVIESVTGSAWPRCDHGTHPRIPTEAGWGCPVDARPAWPFGTVSDREIPAEPDLADNVVRWFLEDRGWGVIAHRDGDLFVHFSAIEGTGYRALREGEVVTVTSPGLGMQGRLRQVGGVRRRP
jgi:cold shock protein